MPPEVAVFTHDSRCILDVSDELCAMFRCARRDLIDREIIELLADRELKQLALVRMETLRNKGRVPEVDYLFLRFDGTAFVGHVATVAVDGETRRYESTITRRWDAK